MTLRLMLNGREHHVTILRRRPHLVLSIDGVAHEVASVPPCGDGPGEIVLDGQRMRFVRTALTDAGGGERVMLRLSGRSWELARVDPIAGAAGAGGAQDAIRAPMPGAVVVVHRSPGDSVARGDVIVTIESMKLQTALAAPRDGVIARILCSEGETFDKDAVLIELVPQDEGD